MNKYKYILKSLIYSFVPIIISLIFFTILNYFNIISFKLFYILSFIVTLFSFFASGFYLAKHSENKGLIKGLIMGGINTGIFLVLAIIFSKITLFTWIYYIILILSSVTGGVIGINYNKK